jgi:hypothetical protein
MPLVPGPQVRRSAFSIAEALIAMAVLGTLIGAAVWFFGFAGRTVKRLTPQLGAQQGGRRAVARLLRELQEGMEVLSPSPGQTLAYAVIADKLAQVRWFFLKPQAGSNPPLFELWRRFDGTPPPGEIPKEKLLTNVKRLTFTSSSEGAVQINLLMAEDTAEYSLLTTIRMRNIASSEELW